MKISELAKELFKDSEFTSVDSLSREIGIEAMFIRRFFNGKNTTEKLDVVFDKLTEGIELDEFMLALEMIKRIKSLNDSREQFL